MSKTTETVSLVDGESVEIDIGQEIAEHHTFVRLSPILILSIRSATVKKVLRYDHLYLWQKVRRGKNTPYYYLGDLTFASGRSMGAVVGIGLTFAKKLPKKWKRRALKQQRELSNELLLSSDHEEILNSVLVHDGFLCSALFGRTVK